MQTLIPGGNKLKNSCHSLIQVHWSTYPYPTGKLWLTPLILISTASLRSQDLPPIDPKLLDLLTDTELTADFVIEP